MIETTVVGSYPQPDWLIDRAKLGSKVPRVRAPEIWRIEERFLEEAQDDATLLAIRDMERAGIDIITDGEMRRESYSNRFATALEGVDIVNPGSTINRTGTRSVVPRIAGPIRRRQPVEVRDVQFLRRHTTKKIKITLPGPFTMAQQAQDDYYKDEEALAMAFAAAVNEELRELKAAGADVLQLDEPWLQARAERAARYGVKAINRALAGHRGHHGRPFVLRLRGGGKGQAQRLLLPAAARRQHRVAGVHRGRAAAPRSGRAPGPRRKKRHARGHRSVDRYRRDAGGGRGPHPRRPEACPGRAPGGRARLRHEVPQARHRVRQAEVPCRRSGAGAPEARMIPKVLHEHINSAFPANVALVGTVQPNGYAQISPRGSTMVYDDQHLALWERGKGSTNRCWRTAPR